MPEIAYLTDPGCPLRIEYSRPVMERIRGQACDGLMALPRIGMGVGGLLLGVREDGLVRLLDSIEIHCSHASGPSFHLTDEEMERARELIAGAGVPGVIGWYCSKPRASVALGDVDHAFYREFFPQPDQIALVLRPSTVEPTHAAFFFRDDQGKIVKGIEYDLDEWRPEPEAADADEVKGDTETGPEEIEIAPVATPVIAPRAESIPFAIASATTSEPEPHPRAARPSSPVGPGPDIFAFAGEPRRQSKRPLWIMSAILLLAVGTAAWFTQDSWLPRPPLNLASTESGGSLTIRWNADAFRGIDHASLFVNDDGNLVSLPLDRFQLNQGMFNYVHGPKSQRVSAKLTAGDSSAIAVWLAPAPPTGATGGTEPISTTENAPPAVTETRQSAQPRRKKR